MNNVNIIITCYNKEKTIARAIKTVKGQTLKDFFCVVVDDGSNDDSWQIINAAIKDDERFIAVKLENGGVAQARNFGISLGNAPYVTCLDGDDGLQPEFLATCYNAISKMSDVGIVYTDVLLAHPDSYFTVARWPDAQPKLQFEGKNQVPCCNMFRRDIFERIGGYKQRYAPRGAGAEDAELWLRFFKLGYTAKKITNEPLFVYNAYGGITQNGNYNEVNWTNWHTVKPMASLAKTNNITHTINEYDQPEISVIIPVGPNHIHYLTDALDSLEAQTFTNWEVIVVCDGVDNYINTKEKLKITYPYIKILGGRQNHGAGWARNFGLQKASGEYVVFLDSDDYLQPKFLELTLSAQKHFNADWVYTDLYTQAIYNEADYKKRINELDKQDTEHYKLRDKNDAIEIMYPYQCDEFSVDKLFNGGVAAVTALYKKADILAVGCFDEENNREDWDLHFKLAQAGKCGLRLPLPLFTYRLHTGVRREYKYDETIDFAQGKELDKQRLYKLYDYEELKMACSSCKKPKITIKSANESDLTKLEYIGKNTGGTINGIVTKRPYPIDRQGDKFILFKVHPQDAQEFINRGLVKPISNNKPKTQPIMTHTTKPTKVIKMSREEQLQAVNERAAQDRLAARRQVEAYFSKPAKDEIEYHAVLQTETTNRPAWVRNPDDYSIKQLKPMLNELSQADLRVLLSMEKLSKNRKGIIKLVEGLLDD